MPAILTATAIQPTTPLELCWTFYQTSVVRNSVIMIKILIFDSITYDLTFNKIF
ncbi:hypothetical protein HMPREF9104_02362 [Lentilactobacillus kisonensis F0435]|uniref:Uncharacterized protein n=1 Tax=Lentilactobacillus kisonensis F0435 TaxID=797516 RepID=H1LIC1_9LACO|nr:hypothetical protein HMPREF9104_02362 [Lentilactobacillus kisonensis F0435]